MLRQYETGTTDTVKVFSGLEVEHTPAFGKQTLFLATNELTFDQIQELAVKVNAEAIYYGANRTFMHNIGTQVAQMMKFLDMCYYVTIDYQYNLHDEVKKRFSAVWNKDKFIPFCSVIFENSDEDSNLCFKIDDIDFDKTNHKQQVKKNMKPFEELFFEVGAEILKNMDGWMAVNPAKSVQNMRKKLKAAISDIRAGGNIKKLNKLKTFRNSAILRRAGSGADGDLKINGF